jgi:hypothetical protein
MNFSIIGPAADTPGRFQDFENQYILIRLFVVIAVCNLFILM